VREDHLRYMQKWGWFGPGAAPTRAGYAFGERAVVRQADAELAAGVSFRRCWSLLSSRHN
jgi:hypothetical protein